MEAIPKGRLFGKKVVITGAGQGLCNYTTTLILPTVFNWPRILKFTY